MSKENVYRVVTDRIIAQLEAGVPPWKKSWHTPSGTYQGFPKNLISGKEYRGGNIFLLAASGFTSPFWLTFKQAVAIGAKVRKGERGTPIVYWLKRERSTDQDSETGSPRRFMVPLYSYVFNAEQCQDFPPDALPSLSGEGPISPLPACQALVEAMPAPPRIIHSGYEASYTCSQDLVRMPPRSLFDSPAHYYSTLFHELIHSTGHPSRLDRDMSGAFGSAPYAREELVAELGAAMLCGVAGGIEPVKVETIVDGEPTLLESTASYLSYWIKTLNDEPQAFMRAAGRAQRAADFVLRRSFDEAPEEEEKAA